MAGDVSDCSAARFAALVEGDLQRLSSLLAEDLRYVHATGLCHDRMGYIEFVCKRLKFLEVRLESRSIKQFGEIAVITGLLHQRIVRTGESESVTLKSWAIEVWKDVGGWRLVDFQSTRVAL